MSEIVFCQPVFGANQSQTNLNVNSILSLVDYLKASPLNSAAVFDVVLGGWCSEEIYWNQIIDAAKQLPENCNVSLKKFDRNYGKSFVVNNLLGKYLPAHQETKFILTCDSDMLFLKEHVALFQRAVTACQVSEKFRKIKTGFVALNQAADNCHWIDTFDCKIPYKIKVQETEIDEQIAWPSNGCGIAGGCLLITREAWDKVGGYHQYPNFYGSDDGLLLREVQQAGFSANVLVTCSMEHPKQNDAAYIALKKDAMKDPFEDYTPEKYQERIKKSEDFWKSRNEPSVDQ